jgi:hypothetical protein
LLVPKRDCSLAIPRTPRPKANKLLLCLSSRSPYVDGILPLAAERYQIFFFSSFSEASNALILSTLQAASKAKTLSLSASLTINSPNYSDILIILTY